MELHFSKQAEKFLEKAGFYYQNPYFKSHPWSSSR